MKKQTKKLLLSLATSVLPLSSIAISISCGDQVQDKRNSNNKSGDKIDPNQPLIESRRTTTGITNTTPPTDAVRIVKELLESRLKGLETRFVTKEITSANPGKTWPSTPSDSQYELFKGIQKITASEASGVSVTFSHQGLAATGKLPITFTISKGSTKDTFDFEFDVTISSVVTNLQIVESVKKMFDARMTTNIVGNITEDLPEAQNIDIASKAIDNTPIIAQKELVYLFPFSLSELQGTRVTFSHSKLTSSGTLQVDFKIEKENDSLTTSANFDLTMVPSDAKKVRDVKSLFDSKFPTSNTIDITIDDSTLESVTNGMWDTTNPPALFKNLTPLTDVELNGVTLTYNHTSTNKNGVLKVIFKFTSGSTSLNSTVNFNVKFNPVIQQPPNPGNPNPGNPNPGNPNPGNPNPGNPNPNPGNPGPVVNQPGGNPTNAKPEWVYDNVRYTVAPVANVNSTSIDTEINTKMKSYHPDSFWQGFTGKKYTITGIGDAKFSFIFDNRSQTTEAEDKKFIDKFLNETNWGVGIASVRNIFLLSEQSPAGYAGVADEFSDMWIWLPKTLTPEQNISASIWKDYAWSIAFECLQHEYGHHETMSMYRGWNVGSGNPETSMDKISEALVKNSALASNIVEQGLKSPRNWNPDLRNIQTKFVDEYFKISGDPISGILKNIFGNNALPFNLSDRTQVGDMFYPLEYNFNSAEYLNRFINVFESIDYTEGRNTWLKYMSPVYYNTMQQYQLNGTPIVDLDDSAHPYTAGALKTVDLYKKYVWGFDNPNVKKRIIMDGFAVRGYSDKIFDWLIGYQWSSTPWVEYGNIPGYGANGQINPNALKLKRVPTHFFYKNNLNGPKQFIDTNGWGYYALIAGNINFSGGANVGVTPGRKFSEVFRDANNDGKYSESTDTRATYEFRGVSNYDSDLQTQFFEQADMNPL